MPNDLFLKMAKHTLSDIENEINAMEPSKEDILDFQGIVRIIAEKVEKHDDSLYKYAKGLLEQLIEIESYYQ